jgi:hypothetical protein
MEIIRAIIAGEREPQTLAMHRDARCKHDQETIAKALTGHWRVEHLFALRQAVEQYDFVQDQLQACDSEIEACLQAFLPQGEVASSAPTPVRKWRSSQRNAPSFDVHTYLKAMTGVDLTQIDGIDSLTALKVVSEIGFDMTRWPTGKHFAAWLGLCPGNKMLGGKRHRMRSKPTANRAATALRLAAQSLANSHSALGAYYRRMRARLGAPKAITATAHKLARLVYSMLRYGTAYVDAGQQAYEQQYRDRVLTNLQRKARVFGYQLVQVEGTDRAQAVATL